MVSALVSPATDWFDEWTEYHLRAFGLPLTDDFLQTFLVWKEVFRHLRYGSTELWAATADMVASPPPPARFGELLNSHLRAIHQSVRDRRKAARGGSPGTTYYSACSDCGNSGWVTVPHPRDVDNGSWLSSLTAAVTCRCSAGRATIAPWESHDPTVKEKTPPMTLDRYVECVLTDWRRVMTERDALTQKMRDRDGPPTHGDGAKLLDKIDDLWRRYVRKGAGV